MEVYRRLWYFKTYLLRCEQKGPGRLLPVQHPCQSSLNTEMDSFFNDNSWASQVSGQGDSILDFTIPLEFTSPLEGEQPGSQPTPTTLAGSNHQFSNLPSLTGPVVQTYQ